MSLRGLDTPTIAQVRNLATALGAEFVEPGGSAVPGAWHILRADTSRALFYVAQWADDGRGGIGYPLDSTPLDDAALWAAASTALAALRAVGVTPTRPYGGAA